ncbi:MAG TPA: rhamnogalacturonan acetylesterase [Candidatus Aquilonibacter sp.]|nr:rhamnogalacturonan acetylesterase [Candidatus Aquilonibacter sp.]
MRSLAPATLAIVLALAPAAVRAQHWTCTSHASHHAIQLTAATTFTPAAAGWDVLPPPESITASGCSSAKSFFFSAPVAEGNYEVTVELGGNTPAVTTVKAEARRIMLARIATAANQTTTERFIVNVRVPQIAGDGEVHRKPREMNSLDWDNKLTLEFAGDHPSVRSIAIRPAPAYTHTVYLAGDSTVVDQDLEPWAAWGQMLPAFFDSHIAIANNAESGETIRSFESENRFAKIFSVIKPGDYLFFQFAHNDQKPGRGYVSPEQYTELLDKYIAKARAAGATPVLVTSMNRRSFDATGHITDTLAPYPETMRKVAQDQHVALIDLNAMSKQLYEAIGEPHSTSLFVYAPANTYPNQPVALHDDTHFNAYGAWELARCVVLGIQQDKLPLAKFLRPQPPFDPSHPDAASAVALPQTPFFDATKPYER